MSKATYPLKLPLSVKEAAARLAKADGVSLNQWIASAVAQKVGAMETAADFLRRRAGDASAVDFGKMLERVAGGPPQAGDELPPDRH
ncbi:MAG: pilus assembly protein HicB [Mesorhizobium sp.]|nr:MAG: pilus assembly protein HicB [Mesorhizobium sp.]